MKKKNNLLIFIIPVVLIVLAIYFFSGNFMSTISGATIFSVDEVNVRGKNKDDIEWVIAASANGAGEYIVGSVNQETLEKYNINSFPAESFDIKFYLEDYSWNYDLKSTDYVVGKLYEARVTEQCLGNPCPFEYVDLKDVQLKCRQEGGENCEDIIELSDLPGTGTYSAWCSWFPEESNQPQDGECELSGVQAKQIRMRIHGKTSGCDFCQGEECLNYIQQNRENIIEDRWTGYYTRALNLARQDSNQLCLWRAGTVSGVAKDNGDWRVQQFGIEPKYDVFKFSTSPEAKYKVRIVLTTESGKEYEAVITEKDRNANLGEIGKVDWSGNLLGTQFPQNPAIDRAALRNIKSNEYKIVETGAGSLYDNYLNTLQQMTRIDNNYFTYTLVTPTEVRAVDPGTSADSYFTRYTILNSLYEDIKNENGIKDDCEIVSGNNLLNCETETPVLFPQLKLTIKASEIGIYTPRPTPKIQGFGSSRNNLDNDISSINPNTPTDLFFKIGNIGDEAGSFDVKLDCPFPVTQQAQRLSLYSGESKITPISIIGNGLIQECKVVTTNVGDASLRDEMKLRMVVNPLCNIYGVNSDKVLFTEYGCIARINRPDESCTNDEFYLEPLDKCIKRDDIDTGEERLKILEEVENVQCNTQCNGNKGCVEACLQQGGVKPICVGVGNYMSLNDYLCDYENQPNIQVPEVLNNKVWVDAPSCQYVCEFGFEGADCKTESGEMKFDYNKAVPSGNQISSSKECETCFDGVKNQDEEDVDCGGICVELYGRDKECGKLDSPLHCYNNKEDGDEEGIDCGGSCDFGCDEKVTPGQPGVINNIDWTIIIVVLLIIVGIIGGLIYFKKKI